MDKSNTKRRECKIVVVGQTPPPFGGQAVMIQTLLDGQYEGFKLIHIRMDFSKEFDELGRWKFVKMVRLVRIVLRIWYAKLRWMPELLYYPPSGPALLPIFRDIAILIPTRWLFRKTIFHFHASGLSEFRPKLKPLIRVLYDTAFRRPDVSIRISKTAPSEGTELDTKHERIVANGIDDEALLRIRRRRPEARALRMLFVALLVEDKGLFVLLESFALLVQAGWDVTLSCVGQWSSPHTEAKAKQFLAEAGLGSRVHFPGVMSGEPKWELYQNADLFCFPSFFHSETFPLVLLEAMCFGLPIVTTRWRGIPDVVKEGENALLVPVRNVEACSGAVNSLLADDAKRLVMGEASRQRFMANFTVAHHRREMLRTFQFARDLV